MLQPQKSPPGKLKNKLVCKVDSLKTPAGICQNRMAAAFKSKLSLTDSERKKPDKVFMPIAATTVRRVFFPPEIKHYVKC